MTKYLHHTGELERLNDFCANKIIDRIDIDHGDSITIFFIDGSYAVLSTLGGVSIESLNPALYNRYSVAMDLFDKRISEFAAAVDRFNDQLNKYVNMIPSKDGDK